MFAISNRFGGFQFLELRSTLPDELLMYGDKLSMAHGLEARVPFLDREIVEWVERLDASFKVRHFSQKWLHRRVCHAMLPATVLRRKKRMFSGNVADAWFRNSGESGVRELLVDRSALIYQFLDADAVGRLLHDHVSGQHDNHKLLFSLVVLEQWLRQQGHSSPANSPTWPRTTESLRVH